MFNKTENELIAFEEHLADLFEQGKIPHMLHMCGGNEKQLIQIFGEVKEGDYVLSTHRSHYHYLLAGGSEDDLEKKILAGESMHVFDKRINFLSTAILAGMTSIAVGIALALKQDGIPNHVWCFIGDGAEEEGHFYESVRYVDGFDLPCSFIIEDNNRSAWSTKMERRGKSIMNWPSCVRRYEYQSTRPHIGTGSGKMVDFSNYKKNK